MIVTALTLLAYKHLILAEIACCDHAEKDGVQGTLKHGVGAKALCSEKLGKLVAVQILVTKEIEDEHFGGASLEIVLTLAHGDHSFFLKFL